MVEDDEGRVTNLRLLEWGRTIFFELQFLELVEKTATERFPCWYGWLVYGDSAIFERVEKCPYFTGFGVGAVIESALCFEGAHGILFYYGALLDFLIEDHLSVAFGLIN
jgi:hypothetical protein